MTSVADGPKDSGSMLAVATRHPRASSRQSGTTRQGPHHAKGVPLIRWRGEGGAGERARAMKQAPRAGSDEPRVSERPTGTARYPQRAEATLRLQLEPYPGAPRLRSGG